jgi:hypothetical protein
MKKSSLLDLLRKVHNDEEGTVSLETVLLVGAIALPVLIVLLKYGWPKIRTMFDTGIQDLDGTVQTTTAQ